MTNTSSTWKTRPAEKPVSAAIASRFRTSRSGTNDAALAYSFDHGDDIDRRIAEDQALVRALRERTPCKISNTLRSLHGEG